MSRIDKIVVHHTGPFLSRVQNYFRGERYHLFVSPEQILGPDGKPYDGRTIKVAGDSVHIGLVGNFESERPSGKQYFGLVDLLAGLCIGLSKGPECIYGHRELPGQKGKTTCPGKAIGMKELREYVDFSILLDKSLPIVFGEDDEWNGIQIQCPVRRKAG